MRKQQFTFIFLLCSLFAQAQSSNVTATRIRAEEGLRVGTSSSQQVTGFNTTMPGSPTDAKLPTSKCVFDWVTGNAIMSGSTANGDLNGSYPNPTVDGIRGRPISATAPIMGQVMKWSGSQWVPADDDNSGGGGGASDALGTGFTSGGGSGSIPDGTVVDIPHLSYETKIVANSTYGVGDDNYPFMGLYASDGVNKSQIGFKDEDGTPVLILNSQFGVTSNNLTFGSGIDVSSNGAFGVSAGSFNLGTGPHNLSINASGFVCTSTTGAFAPPRVTTVQRDALPNNEGSSIYNLDEKQTQTRSDGVWKGTGIKYKVYTALLSQSGTDAPVATVLENTLGGTVVWSYASPGTYVATLSGAFTSNKTFLHLENLNWDGSANNLLQYLDVNTCRLLIAAGDDFISSGNDAQIEIRVYP